MDWGSYFRFNLFSKENFSKPKLEQQKGANNMRIWAENDPGGEQEQNPSGRDEFAVSREKKEI